MRRNQQFQVFKSRELAKTKFEILIRSFYASRVVFFIFPCLRIHKKSSSSLLSATYILIILLCSDCSPSRAILSRDLIKIQIRILIRKLLALIKILTASNEHVCLFTRNLIRKIHEFSLLSIAPFSELP